MNKKNTKMSESHKFDPNMSERIDLENSDNYAAFQNLSIHYISKNITKQ